MTFSAPAAVAAVTTLSTLIKAVREAEEPVITHRKSDTVLLLEPLEIVAGMATTMVTVLAVAVAAQVQ
jgi:hypothetical protein